MLHGAAACGSDATARGTVPAENLAPPALILHGGTILTMDPDRPEVRALAIRGGEIVAVGADEEIVGLAGEQTRVVDLAGRTATPGLVDGHAHLYGLGTALESVDLVGAGSAEEAAARVAERVVFGRPDPQEPAPAVPSLLGSRREGMEQRLDDGLFGAAWITGRGWDQNRWPDKTFPTHQVLDAVSPKQPVALRRIDGHALWVNAVALRVAKIDAATPDPPGGRIIRDARGAPTGVFIDAAMALVESHIPPPDAASIRARIQRGATAAVAAGLTGVHEMGIGDEVAQVYRELAAAGELPLRVNAFLSGSADNIEALLARDPEPDDGDDFFSVRSIKMYADGALGSRGAALLAPYADEPEHTGLWVTSPEDLRRAAMLAAGRGWQLGIHAIGDAANRAVLDAYQAAAAAHPDADLRFRIEHAQIVAPEDLPRFGALGVLAAMQPTHATSDMPWVPARVGDARLAGAYAWRTIADAGGVIVAGSDFPVERVSPLLGLYAAVTRQDSEGNPPGGWLPAQRLRLSEALAAFTRGPARAAFVEDHRGMLRAGYVADITVYDRGLMGDASLLETRVDMTIVGGRVVYQRD